MNERRSLDSFGSLRQFSVAGRDYDYFSAAAVGTGPGIPATLRILLENLLRHEDGLSVDAEAIQALASWKPDAAKDREILFHPNRLVMHDTTGGPALVDLAALRDAMVAAGRDPQAVNPQLPVDLVIDHSVAIDEFGTPDAFDENVRRELERNRERYAFFRWAEGAFRNFRVFPPGSGIIHSINLEYLSQVVCTAHEGTMVYPDAPLVTDSHTPMINGLGVLGWGIGGIEAEAIMLGQPVALRIPDVVGFRLEGQLPAGTSTSDLVLTVTELLRTAGVVGKFVEFRGSGLESLTVPDRATIANMAPEYGATVCYFPIDGQTLAYLRQTGRPEAHVSLVEAYARAQGLWNAPEEPEYAQTLRLDLATVEPSMAGPHRPQDRVALGGVHASFDAAVEKSAHADDLPHGAVAIAAITSCTTTANPDLVVAAGLLARAAAARGLTVKPWVKTSLAPGSQAVAEYLAQAGLQPALDALGFNVVAVGCTTCIGNSGPLLPDVAKAVEERGATVCGVLSGNRNFPGRVHPHLKAAYLASPALVVAYALAGTVCCDLTRDPLGHGSDGRPVYLADLWPSRDEVRAAVEASITPDLFLDSYARVFDGNARWDELAREPSATFSWDENSPNLRRPPFLQGIGNDVPPIEDLTGARMLVLLGDDVTTDDLSSAGAIAPDSPAADYLRERGLTAADFNVYATYRGNYEVMIRAAFSNLRLRGEMAGVPPGPFTCHQPSGEILNVFHAAQRHASEGTPLVVVGGRAFGCGSSRDWAAKGLRLLGVRAVIAESFERLHRTNLIGMGVIPLQFQAGTTRKTLRLDGSEVLDVEGLAAAIETGRPAVLRVIRPDGSRVETRLDPRVETAPEAEFLRQGGILPTLFRRLSAAQ